MASLYYRSIIGILLVLVMGCKVKEKFVKSGELQSQELSVGGSTLHINKGGQGDPIIIIHGGPGLDHSYFLPHMLGLSDYFELFFYDQRGCGKSSLNEDVHLDDLIDDIERIRKNLQEEKVHILGHSWGGLLAMKYAIRYEEHVKTLILMNSAAPSDSLKLLTESAFDSLEQVYYRSKLNQIRESTSFQNHESVAFEKFFKVLFQSQFYDTTRLNELIFDFPEDFYERNLRLRSLNQDLQNYDITSDLKYIKAPTIIIYGVKEPAADIVGPILWENIPNSSIAILPRCGHFPFIEQPTKLFEEILEFVNYYE